MSLMYGVFGILGFVFGLNAFVQLDAIKKRLAALEAAQGRPAQ
jgi:hypothetical protein